MKLEKNTQPQTKKDRIFWARLESGVEKDAESRVFSLYHLRTVARKFPDGILLINEARGTKGGDQRKGGWVRGNQSVENRDFGRGGQRSRIAGENYKKLAE